MHILTTAQVLITALYIYIVVKKFGVLTSISASTYSWTGNARWYFLAWLWSIAILNLFQGLDVWGFIASAGIIFTGITIDHNTDAAHGNIVHLVGTIVAIIASFMGIYAVYGMLAPFILFVVTLPALYFVENKIWWIECVAFTIVFGAYYFR